MLKIFFISLWIFTQITHVSFMGVECFPDKEVIKVFLKMSYDDFVFDYRYTINDDQGFDPRVKIDTTNILVSKYLANRIEILADDKTLKGKLANLKSADGDVNIELLYYFNKRAKSFRVKSTILSGLNKNQSTLLIFKHNDYEEGVRLTQDNSEHTFTIK